MSKPKALDLSRCRFCGDISAVDADTWEALGECAACSHPAVQAGHTRRKKKTWTPSRCRVESRLEIARRKTDSMG